MGADLVIAVELNDTQQPPYEPTSALSVLDRSISVMILANELRNLRLANLVLSPQLKNLSSTDFDQLNEFIRRGYAAAARQEQFLLALALSETDWKEYQSARRARRRTSAVSPQFIAVEGAVGGNTEEFERKLAPFHGVPIESKRLENALTQFTGLGRYQSADYRYVQRGSETGLLVRLHQKSYGPPILNTVLDIDGADVSNVLFGVGVRLTFMDFGGPASEWRTDVNLGYRNAIGSEYYYRIKGSPVFIAPRLFVDYSRLGIFDQGNRIAEYRTEELGGGVDFGVVAGRFNEFRVGVESSHVRAFVSTGSPVLPRLEGAFSVFRAKWQYQGLDAPIVPRNGVQASSEIRWVFDSPLVRGSYPVVDSQLVIAKQFRRRNIFIIAMAGGTTAGNEIALQGFTLGGPIRLSALSRNEVIGDNYYYSGFFYLRSLTNKELTFFGRAYFTFGYELGNAYTNSQRANAFHDGLLGIIAETPLGGIFVGGSVGEQGHRKFFFRVGRIF
jgi:NTE family protein